jgi:hypothetical protein
MNALLRTLFLSGAVAVAAGAAPAPAAAPRIFLAGDSTMANKPLDLPERGWGMALGELFVDGVAVRSAWTRLVRASLSILVAATTTVRDRKSTRLNSSHRV